MQSPSTVHVVLQAPTPQTYGAQLDEVGAAQPPLPLQCEIGVYVDPEHDTVPQATPVPATWQAPAPLHAPVFPHGGLGAHRPCGSAASSGTLVQLPALPWTLHAWQVGHAAALQHTPSTQLAPVRQSAVPVHDWPRRRLLPQKFVSGSQIAGARQSVSTVQAPRHAVVPLHM